MIKDFVRNGHAYLRCTECGAEHLIISPTRVKQFENFAAFVTKHVLCKRVEKQLKNYSNTFTTNCAARSTICLSGSN